MTKQKFLAFILMYSVGLLFLPTCASPLHAAGDDDDSDSSMRLQEKETIRKTFNLTAPHKILEVDNIFGSIEVTGGQGDQVQLVVNKTISAESKDRMDAAKKEVTLDITDQPDLLKLFVNSPSRCNCGPGGGDKGCFNWRGDPGYIVKMDFQLQVPRNIEVKLKTVNSGHVSVQDVTGDFSVHNVNGGIDMKNVAGSGVAKTVNGPVKVSFRENPREKSDFATINGNVELYFVRGLSGDFRFKTMNGAVYTDFEMTSLPAQPVSAEHRGAKFVFRSDRFTGGRIGSGGPEIKAENLNGDIRVLERHE
jgi:hypothetical protein